LCNNEKENSSVNQLKTLSKEVVELDGPDEIQNPDDVSGARFGVFRYAQYRKKNHIKEKQLEKSLVGPMRFELMIPAV
jgi:hypothetical protein